MQIKCINSTQYASVQICINTLKNALKELILKCKKWDPYGIKVYWYYFKNEKDEVIGVDGFLPFIKNKKTKWR